MNCVSCLPAPFSGRHTHRSGQDQNPVLLRPASGVPSTVMEKLKLAGTGRFRSNNRDRWFESTLLRQPVCTFSIHLGEDRNSTRNAAFFLPAAPGPRPTSTRQTANRTSRSRFFGAFGLLNRIEFPNSLYRLQVSWRCLREKAPGSWLDLSSFRRPLNALLRFVEAQQLSFAFH